MTTKLRLLLSIVLLFLLLGCETQNTVDITVDGVTERVVTRNVWVDDKGHTITWGGFEGTKTKVFEHEASWKRVKEK